MVGSTTADVRVKLKVLRPELEDDELTLLGRLEALGGGPRASCRLVLPNKRIAFALHLLAALHVAAPGNKSATWVLLTREKTYN